MATALDSKHEAHIDAAIETAGAVPSSHLVERLHEHEEERGAEAPLEFLDWAQLVPEPKTGPLDFRRFPFQPAMYRVFGSPVKDVVVRKATQVGASALLTRWGVFQSERFGRTTLYVFPTEGDVYDYSDARVDPMIFASEFLSGRRGMPWNKGLKRVGTGLVYFRGSENKRGLDSVDADALCLDEYDTLNQNNIPDAERRLSGVTSAGLIRRIGVPSLPEYGIAERFDESDRRKWLVRCPSCRHIGEDQETKEGLRVPRGQKWGWQELTFWNNVDVDELRIVCQWCHGPLDVAKGTWVAQQPDGDLPGFHLSRLIVPAMPLKGIVKDATATKPHERETFFNKDLGLPFVSKESRLSPEDVHAAISAGQSYFGHPLAPVAGYSGPNPTTMGIDCASERAFNVRVSELLPGDEDGQDFLRKRALWIGEVNDPEELRQMMDRYQVTMAAIDAAPETRIAKALANRFPGRVYLVRYFPQGKPEDPFVVDDVLHLATVDRTVTFDAMVERFRRQHNFPYEDVPHNYIAHLGSSVRRVLILDETTGRTRVVWESNGRPDDYAHAENYDEVAGALLMRRLLIDWESRETLQPLDQLVQFDRTTVDDLTDSEYRLGPGGSDDSMYET